MLNSIAHWARQDPDRIALCDSGVALSYGQFIASACGLVRHLSRQNFRKTGIAAVIGDSIYDEWLLTTALRAMGMQTVCVSSLEQLRDASLFRISVIVIGAERAAALRVPPEYFGCPRVIVPQSCFSGGDGGAEMPADISGAATGGHLLITTGTTGSPRAIFYPDRNDQERREVRATHFGFTRQTVYYAASFPLYTAIGFKNPAATWHRGGSVVLDFLPYDAPVKLPDDISSAVLTPAGIGGFAKSLRISDRVRRNATIRVSGGFLNASVWSRIHRSFERPIEVYFASTEIIGIILRSQVSNQGDLAWMSPDQGRRIEVVDEDGRLCPDGVEGQMRVSLTDVDAEGYFADASATARSFRDGFFYPGDIAVRRQDGKMRVLGRVSDVINIKGHKLASAPIEHSILQVLQAEEVCAFSGTDRSGEDQLVIACRRATPLAPSEQRAAEDAVRKLGPVKIIQLKEFPQRPGAMQKTDRFALRKLVFS